MNNKDERITRTPEKSLQIYAPKGGLTIVCYSHAINPTFTCKQRATPHVKRGCALHFNSEDQGSPSYT